MLGACRCLQGDFMATTGGGCRPLCIRSFFCCWACAVLAGMATASGAGVNSVTANPATANPATANPATVTSATLNPGAPGRRVNTFIGTGGGGVDYGGTK